jgi:DNA polymerase III delta prime subunit
VFDVDKIRDVEYNNDAFEDLAMPQRKKDLMASLLKAHANKALHFDDVIKGKGKGLVFLLHGPPGVGKTLTAGIVIALVWRCCG